MEEISEGEEGTQSEREDLGKFPWGEVCGEGGWYVAESDRLMYMYTATKVRPHT